MNLFKKYVVMALCVPPALISCPADQDIPLEPIPFEPALGWSNTYHLANGQIELIIAPDAGRVIFMGEAGSSNNILRMNAELSGKVPTAADANEWFNYGGDWLWPVSQPNWVLFQDGDWPPSQLIDGRPWTGRAWRCADGTLCCRLDQEYGAPINARVSRTFCLPQEGSSVEVRQEIERTAASTIPVTLWNISQVSGADRALLPGNTNSVQPMKFAAPPADLMMWHNDTMMYFADQPGEAKFGGKDPSGWVAARKNGCLLLEQAVPEREPTTPYPDGGCTAEIYSNHGLGYTEIETLSEEIVLKPGEILANTLHITLLKAEEADADLARQASEAAQR